MTTVRQTNRWRGVSGVALLAGGLGVLFSRPLVLLVGVVGVAFAAYARAASAPTVDLAVTRTLSDPEPRPGDEVTVTVTVENAGDALLPDLRLVDGVPDALAVVDGSPRRGTALRPGRSVRLTYTVEAAQGEHTFDPVLVAARDVSGAIEVETTAGEPSTMTCVARLGSDVDVPLRDQTTRYAGRVTTDDGGHGLEFHATREYRHGDPLSRVDWNHLARTRELRTVQFRQERAPSVVVLVDTREAAYRAPGQHERNAVEHGVAAAGTVVDGLLDAGDRVGLGAVGPVECWLAPGAGQHQTAVARELLASHEAFSPVPPEAPFYPRDRVRWLKKRLPAATQVVFVSPLCDDFAPEIARRIDIAGHRVTVLSPDPTAADTPGRRFARLRRRQRLSDLRGSDIPVVDWDPTAPVAVALAREARARRGSA